MESFSEFAVFLWRVVERVLRDPRGSAAAVFQDNLAGCVGGGVLLISFYFPRSPMGLDAQGLVSLAVPMHNLYCGVSYYNCAFGYHNRNADDTPYCRTAQ